MRKIELTALEAAALAATRERFAENDIAATNAAMGLLITVVTVLFALAINHFGLPTASTAPTLPQPIAAAQAQVPVEQIRPITLAMAADISAVIAVVGSERPETTAPAAVSTSVEPTVETYVVQRGDTLTHVADRFGTTVKKIARDNKIKNPDLILVGQYLKLQQTGSAPPVTMAKQSVSPGEFANRGGASPGKQFDPGRVAKPHTASSRPSAMPETSAPRAEFRGTSLSPSVVDVGGHDCRTTLSTGRVNAKQYASREQQLDCIEQEYGQLIREAAQTVNLSASLIKAVMYVESQGNPGAMSPTGCLGLMQLLRSTAKEYGVALEQIFDPRENILGGARVLADYLRRYSRGDLALALASYNEGPGAMRRAVRSGVDPARHPYTEKVLGTLRFIETRQKTRVELRSPNPA